MQIHIHIDGRLARVFGRRSFKRALLMASILVPCLAFGAATTTPNTFEAGTVISAAQVNENFTAVTTGINGVETRVTALETKALPSANAVLAYAGTSVGDGPLTRTFNSMNGNNVVAGTGGLYTVTLNGIDCGAAAPGTGIAVAQAAGASGISCRVNGDWNNVNNACRIFVGCFNTSGNSVSTPFSLIYMR